MGQAGHASTAVFGFGACRRKYVWARDVDCNITLAYRETIKILSKLDALSINHSCDTIYKDIHMSRGIVSLYVLPMLHCQD